MFEFEKRLLTLAYQHYLGTEENLYRFVPNGANELAHTINSLNSLEQDGYVEVLTDNLDKDTLDLLSEDIVFLYLLTDKGLSFIRDAIKP